MEWTHLEIGPAHFMEMMAMTQARTVIRKQEICDAVCVVCESIDLAQEERTACYVTKYLPTYLPTYLKFSSGNGLLGRYSEGHEAR